MKKINLPKLTFLSALALPAKKYKYIFTSLALLAPVNAATVNFDAFRSQAGQSNLPINVQFLNAVRAAGNGGVLILGHRTYTSSKTFLIDRDVTVIGQGRGKTALEMSVTGRRTLSIGSNGVTVRNLRVRNRDNFGITTFGKFNVSIESVTVEGARYGIDVGFGGNTEGLKIVDCEFHRIRNYGVWFISRDGFGPSQKAKRWHGRFVIDRNDFFTANAAQRQPLAAINLDWGNERAADEDWGVDHSSGGSAMSLIRKNVIRPSGEWNIALARTKNILVQANKCQGGTINGYTQALHIEDRSDNIVVNWNELFNNMTGRGAHAVAVEASNVNAAQTCSRINISNNRVRSRSSVAAIQATDTQDLRIANNRFENPRAFRDIFLWERDSSRVNVRPVIVGNTAVSGAVNIQQ